MQTRLILKPGEKGTKKLVAEYGDRLLCVRYRYDPDRRVRLKTAEVVVEEIAWDPAAEGPVPMVEGDPPSNEASVPTRTSKDDTVRLKIAWGEQSLRDAVKKAGGRWKPEARAWELCYTKAVELGLEGRLVPEPGAGPENG